MGKVISKFVFMPPKNPGYIRGDVTLLTKHESNIQVKIIDSGAKYYLLVSHGNAEDLQSVYEWAITVLLAYININVIIYGT